jgi:hypothetical protein
MTTFLFFPDFCVFWNEATSSTREGGEVWLLLVTLPPLGSDTTGSHSLIHSLNYSLPRINSEVRTSQEIHRVSMTTNQLMLSDHEPQIGLDTKSDWLAERQSQCDSDFDTEVRS